MTFYIGRPGDLLAFSNMGQGIDASLELVTAIQRALGGARTVDVIGQPRRTYAFAAKYQNAFELAQFEALAIGAYGPGPYVLLDPWRLNLLTANQSSGTDVLATTEGFVQVVGTVASSTAQADIGLRSLAHAVTVVNSAAITGSLVQTLADPLTDVPVRPLVTYTAQFRGRLSTSTGSVRADINWYDAAGVFISTSMGTPVVLSTGSFTTVTVSATAPAGAALARIRAWNTAMGAAQTIYLDKWQMEEGSVASSWRVGTGVPRVAFTALSDSYPITPYHDVACTLVEVG